MKHNPTILSIIISFAVGILIGIIWENPNIIQQFQSKHTISYQDEILAFAKNPQFTSITLDPAKPDDLREFPSVYFTDEAFMRQVRYITIKHGHIQELPDNIGQFENLMELNIFDNKLTTLPSTIGSLKNLKRLTVSGNILAQLPKDIGNMQSLETLIVNNNDLDTLPETMGTLKSLKILDIRNNAFTTLPSVLNTMNFLQTLYLNGNPLDDIQIQTLQTSLPNTNIVFTNLYP
jgi:Leucine-rich repeat (LRR) protein